MAIQKVFGGLIVVAAAAIGISVAPPAAADPTNCQTVGGTTVCGQGGVGGGGQSATPAAPAPHSGAGGCTNPYGGYQNCHNGG